jgi:XTP/dITP diphosphohydrolase
MKIVFATNNKDKLREINQILNGKFEIIGLNDIGCYEDIPEEEPTIEGNAYAKSLYVYERYGVNCFADDTGLEVEALDGRPGVVSARYAGEGKDMKANIKKVLSEMEGVKNRHARFKTVISLIFNGKEHQFEGIIKGELLDEEHGEGGFGYDPIFSPLGYQQTFAQMSAELKNQISHRALAMNKLINFFVSA